MNEIMQWLSGNRDYALGVALYKEYGDNAALKTMFATTQTAFSAKKLAASLTAIADALRQSAELAAKERETQSLQKTIARIDQSLDNETVIALDKQAKSQYAQAAFLHGQLRHAPTDEQRKTLAFQILDLFEAVSQGFERVDYYKEFGHLPPPPSEEEQELQSLDRAVLEKMRRNIIANISHARAGRRRAENIPILEQRKEMIERILNQNQEE